MEAYSVTLYNENNEKKKYDIDHFCSEGGCGYVYRIGDDKCLKLFSEFYMFELDVIKAVRKLKLASFYEIYDLLFNEEKQFSGYTMKYYKPEDINILTMPTDYTLDNLFKIYKDLKMLSKAKIYAFDCDSHNVIMNSKNITVIDTDIYYFRKEDDKNKIYKDNYEVLLNLFKSLYYEKIKLLGFSNKDIVDRLDYLFDKHKQLNSVEKKLIKYKYPIDYVNDFYRGRC